MTELSNRREPHHTEVWYELQYSEKGADDWLFSSTYDSVESARARFAQEIGGGFDYRIVKKTLTEEVAE